ncbi:acylphosphatase [Acidobacteria bacterium ACD]|nr:MAG: acylphosphatase [Acidobacteriota bacterium]MCE7957814.1 acylphosphatase [Acidobacteria bacterium ACB2]MDL1950374.1 acylphosphatase [Acidobacteria bacterium ACD]
MSSGWEPSGRRFLVTGRVQGVGYRVFAARAARSLGLSGGASNLLDGGVVVEARGPLHALERLEAFLWEGPRLSRVEKVVVEELAADAPADSDADVTF